MMDRAEAEKVTRDLLWAFSVERGEESTPNSHEYCEVWVSSIIDLDYRSARYATCHWILTEERLPTGVAWWSIRERYLNSVATQREVFLRKTHSGERVPTGLPRNSEIISRQTILHGKTAVMMVRSWHPGVEARNVGAGLRYLAREFKGVPSTYPEGE